MKIFLHIGNFENQMCCFGTQKVKLLPNKPPTFLLLYTITNEKTKTDAGRQVAIHLQDFSRRNMFQ